MSDEPSNGPRPTTPGDAHVLIIFHKDSFTCEITGHVENYDQAICMAQMAQRYFERKLNTAEASKILGPMPSATLPFLRGGKG